MTERLGSRELAFLRIVDASGSTLESHGIERRLASLAVQTEPSVVELARRLEARNLVWSITSDNILYGYAITDRGRDFLLDAQRHSWPLGPCEVAELAVALAGSLLDRITALNPFLADPEHFELVTRQLIHDPAMAEPVAWAIQLLANEHRAAIAFALATDERVAVRAAVFHALGGPGEGIEEQARFKPPSAAFEWDSNPMFIDLLHVGLGDAAFEVRDAAARLVYSTQSGVYVTLDLVADLGSPRPSTWSAAALATARDEASLGLLRQLVASQDDALAGAAVRGLAGRPDGRAEFLAALHDPRRHVAWMAAMGLGYIATGLSADELAAIQRDATSEITTALAYYGSRHR